MVHLTKRFQRRNYLEIGQSETRIACGGFVFLSFLSLLAKGKVNFCHYLATIVCRPLTFHILIFSSETP
jgi:hypothetical protein